MHFDEPPDGGWGWVVVAAGFLTHVNVLGLQYSFGIFFKVLLEDESLGSKGSIASALMLLCSYPAGVLVRRYGMRIVPLVGSLLISCGLFLSRWHLVSSLWMLYFTYGLIAGVGFALTWAPAVIAVNRYFTSKRALCSGLSVAGSGIGTIIFASITSVLIDLIGWRSTLRALAIITGEKEEERSNAHAATQKTETKKPGEQMALVLLVYAAVLWIPYTFLVAFAEGEVGLTSSQSARLVAIMGISSTIGRLLIGRAASFLSQMKLLQASMAITGLAVASLAFLPQQEATLVLFAIFFGSFAGSVVALIAPILVEQIVESRGRQTGGERVGAVSKAPGVVLAAPLGGALRDMTSSYFLTWAAPGLLMVATSFLIPAIHMANSSAVDERRSSHLYQ
ncbi:hypothetical protein GUITHDRAFT_102692 [Guillardia theta CCMP2712]|uniref:Major facilitator superfamily (MFS) profile domain-containing protein n=1 Tax=Guillardia theta (strain CCMP2712) TaxID=905079 RepID=L1JTA3_GUITC|nr:hypothetical protein GUITHDRAFT_102692 [Guillardia theta CCMP2712]EKX51425.1 hypothetical protein GUITHDRAFT_102692 [Guillardia theta CCMP2712]|eukprot:XP_005838405.1 hypothetical protein GUITHDRAFT_102692 [Guillardia theta CCMP2712]